MSRCRPTCKLDGRIVWNGHNTVFGSKRVARTNYVRRCGLLLLNAYLRLLLMTSSGHAHRHRSYVATSMSLINGVGRVGDFGRFPVRSLQATGMTLS